MKILHTFAKILAIVGLVLFLRPAMADRPPDVTQEEIAMLPPWCLVTQTFTIGELRHRQYQAQVARYGESWTHMHHFCWAMLDSNRLYRANTGKPPQYANYTRAVGNIDYVLAATRDNPAFIWRPDLYTHRAKLLRRANKINDALQTAEAFIKEWPQIPDGYVLIADLLTGASRRNEALAFLSQAEKLEGDKGRLERLKSAMLNKP